MRLPARRLLLRSCAVTSVCSRARAEISPYSRGATANFSSTQALLRLDLDVSVLDKDRRPVKGLTSEFHRARRRQAAAIVAFDAIDLPMRPRRPRRGCATSRRMSFPTNAASPRRRHRDGRRYTSTDIDVMEAVTARQIGHAVVDRLGPDDLAAVTFTDMGRRANLTADRAQLKAAVDSFNPP